MEGEEASMLIATIPMRANVEIPRQVLAASVALEIYSTGKPVPPFGADEWITCCQARPHRDNDYKDLLFLTLSVVSSHTTGDGRSASAYAPVPRGTLFVVDPLEVHWLFALSTSEHNAPWIGLQWLVARKEAKAKARKIIEQFDGTWLQTADRRYTGWAPKS